MGRVGDTRGVKRKFPDYLMRRLSFKSQIRQISPLSKVIASRVQTSSLFIIGAPLYLQIKQREEKGTEKERRFREKTGKKL